MEMSLAEKTTQEKQGVGKESLIYGQRFSAAEEHTRNLVWEVLVRNFFQNFVGAGDTVVDIGAGDGQFIKRIRAGRRIAVDLSPHVNELRTADVEVFQVPATAFAEVIQGRADVVFMSNFLEHLPDKRVLLDVLEESRLALKPGGMLLVLQPNIRYVGPAYWDYIDHQIALTEHSLTEALEISGFSIVKVIPRFLPYTAKSRLGRLSQGGWAAAFVKWYLRMPLLWKVFGQQTFVVATPKDTRKS
jgi:SAM-dependent methyltransferase